MLYCVAVLFEKYSIQLHKG